MNEHVIDFFVYLPVYYMNEETSVLLLSLVLIVLQYKDVFMYLFVS